MTKLRNSALAILVALAAIACGGDTGNSAADATDNTGNAANTADTAAAAPDTTADSGTSQGAASDAESVTDVPHLTGEQIAELIDDPNIFLLDVRNADELPEQGAIEGYTLIPIDELADRLDELPRHKTILTI
ncbi:MAG: hypothetical protein PVJ51_11720 [Acidobacteriota bacterium]|jgi:hypothetical protein